MIRKLSIAWDLIFLLGLSLLTRFFYIWVPSKVVFDEAHFGLYATKYLSNQYYFDIHPPLGKMLLSFFGFFAGIKPGFNFEVGSSFGDFNFLALRFLPALFGSLLIPLIYLLAKEIGFPRRAAFLSAFLLLFDNALIVQSRFILLDIILLFFIFLSFYLFYLAKRFPPFSSKWYFFYALTGLSLGAAISIKWTGFGALGIIWFLTVFQDKIFPHFHQRENLIKIGLVFVLPLLFYFLIFAWHFYLIPLPCTENCGAILDSYLKYFREQNNYKNLAAYTIPPSGNIFSKFIELNKLMLASNLSAQTHDYQSDWYSWPFMIRPMLYFKEIQESKTSYIYFFGNPVVWWLGIIGLLGYLYLITKNYFYKFKLKLPPSFYSSGCEMLFLGYLVYLLPFASIERFMLMYHYLPALVFSVILFSVFLDGFLQMIFEQSKKANFLFVGIMLLVLASFLFFSPLTYGFPLTESEFQLRMWLDTWNF